MKKNIDRAILAPQSVLIVATYDENGTPDAMNRVIGNQVGKAFNDGNKLK